MKSGSTLQTTERSLEIVDFLEKRNGARVTEIVDHFDLPKSTIYNHLRTLQHHGYVDKDGDNYHLGLELLHLGIAARDRYPGYKLSNDMVNRLSNKTSEVADFDVVENYRMISLCNTISDENDSIFQTGRRYHMHTSATGKAILAEWPEEKVDEVIDRRGLPKVTDASISSRSRLDEELDAIRDRGYAFNHSELREGLRALGAAVSYPDGHIFGGICIAGPTYQLSDEVMVNHYAEELLDIVDEFERELTNLEWYY